LFGSPGGTRKGDGEGKFQGGKRAPGEEKTKVGLTHGKRQRTEPRGGRRNRSPEKERGASLRQPGVKKENRC